MIRDLMILGSRTFDCGVAAINPSVRVKVDEFKGNLKKKTGDFHPLIVLAVGIIGFGFVLLYKNNVVPQMTTAINTMGSQISTFMSGYSGGAGTGTTGTN